MRPSRLRIELFLRGIKLIDIAEKANVDPAFISRIVGGQQKASSKVAEAIKELTGLDLLEEEDR